MCTRQMWKAIVFLFLNEILTCILEDQSKCKLLYGAIIGLGLGKYLCCAYISGAWIKVQPQQNISCVCVPNKMVQQIYWRDHKMLWSTIQQERKANYRDC